MCMYCERRTDIKFGWNQPKLPYHNQKDISATLSGNVLENEKWEGTIHDYQTACPQLILTCKNYFNGEGTGTIYIHNMFEVGYHRLTDADNYSEYGLSCAGTRLGFPGSFLVQYRENHPDGAEKVLYDKYYDWFDTSIRRKNHDKRSSQALFIRDFEGMHYGVLTDKYAMFDDDEVVDILSQNEYLMSSKEFWSDITPERFHARFVDAEELYIPGDSSPLSLCTFVDNSMVGKSSFKIRFGIYRWACTNGMIAGLKEFEILKMMHKGDKDYVQCVSEALENVEEYKKMLFEMVKEAACTYSSIYNLTEDQALAYIQKKLKEDRTKIHSELIT